MENRKNEQQKNTGQDEDEKPAAPVIPAGTEQETGFTRFIKKPDDEPDKIKEARINNLEETDQYRVNSESIISAKMTTHFGVKVAYLIRYDSRPATGFGKSDRIFTTGLQATY